MDGYARHELRVGVPESVEHRRRGGIDAAQAESDAHGLDDVGQGAVKPHAGRRRERRDGGGGRMRGPAGAAQTVKKHQRLAVAVVSVRHERALLRERRPMQGFERSGALAPEVVKRVVVGVLASVERDPARRDGQRGDDGLENLVAALVLLERQVAHLRPQRDTEVVGPGDGDAPFRVGTVRGLERFEVIQLSARRRAVGQTDPAAHPEIEPGPGVRVAGTVPAHDTCRAVIEQEAILADLRGGVCRLRPRQPVVPGDAAAYQHVARHVRPARAGTVEFELHGQDQTRHQVPANAMASVHARACRRGSSSCAKSSRSIVTL